MCIYIFFCNTTKQYYFQLKLNSIIHGAHRKLRIIRIFIKCINMIHGYVSHFGLPDVRFQNVANTASTCFHIPFVLLM